MQTLPIDATRLGTLTYLSSTPVLRDGSPAIDRATGLPRHEIQLLQQLPPSGDITPRPEVMLVKIPAAEAPTITPMAPVALTDVNAFIWESGGRSGVSLSAAGVEPVGGGRRGE